MKCAIVSALCLPSIGITCMKIISMPRSGRGHLSDGQALGLPQTGNCNHLIILL